MSGQRKYIAAYGEMLLRLKSPGHERLLQSPQMEARFGGAEMNVLASMAQFGHMTRLVTSLPDHALGMAAHAELRALGIDTSAVLLRPGRMGLYFLESGHGHRSGQVIYDRAASAFASDDSERLWTDLLDDVALLHLTGITPALSVRAAANCLAAAQQARRLGATVSVDVNFRARVWQDAPLAAEIALLPLLHQARLLFASSGDLEVSLKLGSTPGASPIEQFERASATALERLPTVDVVCSCLRLGLRADRAQLLGLVRTRQIFHHTAVFEVESTVDRIGSGDAFAAAVLHGHLRGYPIERSIEFGVAASAMKHSIAGDINRASEAEISACMNGDSAALLRR
jgi:2-dehydro-3-deoxygluconokinase